MASLLSLRDDASSPPVPYTRPVAGTVMSVILSFAAICVLSCFLTQRSLAVKAWSRLPLATLLVFTIYADSWAFVFGSGIVDFGIGVDSNLGVCSAAILLCLFFYVTSKVEKAFLAQGGVKRRVDSKLYISNLFGVLTIFGIICILTFVYRKARMDMGQCIVGIERQALIPLITLDVVANLYITALFLNPLWSIYSIKRLSNSPDSSPNLGSTAIRTFIGALCTTTSSVVNLVVLLALDGEPGWVFLTCCNADILFSTLVIQWVTLRDDATSAAASSSPPSHPPDNEAADRPPPRAPPPRPPRQRSQRLTISRPLKTTSTSQYEHIFGDLEPDTETDAVSASSASNHRAGSSSRFDEDNDDGFRASIVYDGPDGDTSDNSAGNERGASSSAWTSPPRPPSARTDARTDGAALGLGKSRPPTPAAQAHGQAQTPTREGASNVSAAVAADLERIRQYRGRRGGWSATTVTTSTSPPPPTLTSIPSTSYSLGRAPRASRRGSARREYYISQLAFEDRDVGGGSSSSQWHELVQGRGEAAVGRSEEGRGGENGRRGADWI
ncbi:uncharacterized protein F4812DRAFT_467611 [Daldinia caldariorum]|uniref:uncharacterized protein n=1 Tax=Daldinia caldariorum TaxID=326644 RepID=UPI002007B7A0|nr:uncharacterized protein F4812DRAFT_467611 [Daldinia caldariorum]KAI1471590.1 hypothetical protein F4812DRAFT_467611 [Daldinia caldariorum]